MLQQEVDIPQVPDGFKMFNYMQRPKKYEKVRATFLLHSGQFLSAVKTENMADVFSISQHLTLY